MKTTTTIISIILLSITCIAAEITGNWRGIVKAPNGENFEITYQLKVIGEQLTGKVISPLGEMPISDGMIKGNDFTFKIRFSNNSTMNATGQILGDSLIITSEFRGTTSKNSFLKVID